MEPFRVGIIDIGSNTIKLQVVEYRSATESRMIHFDIEEVRIGEGMTSSPPTIDPNAINMATRAVARLQSIANQHNLVQLSIVASSAVRNAHNKHEFTQSIQIATGIETRVLSGLDEARLIGKGVLQDPTLRSLEAFTLADLGGGSMEIIQFENQTPLFSGSFNLGAVDTLPPTANRHVKRLRAHDTLTGTVKQQPTRIIVLC